MEIGLNSKLINVRGAYRILAAKSFGKTSLGTAVGRWVDNIKMDLMFIGPCIILIVE